MALHTWLLYLVAAFGLSLTPGPNSLLVLTHGALHGHRKTLFTVAGGVLVQDRDRTLGDVREFKVVTKRQPTADEMAAMMFGWKVGKHVKSNSIVYCRGEQTLGVGAGQMARVDSSRIAVWKAGEAKLDLRGSVVASEALFPFADGLIAAAEAAVGLAILISVYRHFGTVDLSSLRTLRG